MGLRVALFSGGKDSTYAALLEWPIDAFVTLVYEFPRPSPHLVNIGAVVALANAMRVPVIVARLERGREREQTIALLRRLNVDVLVAGDNAVEEHLRYMEGVAAEAGASLREPLWGLDPREVLARELEELRFVVIGVEDQRLADLLCRESDRGFAGEVERLGIDPIGERGEYHTLVTRVERLGAEIRTRCASVLAVGGRLVARVSVD